VLVRGRVDHKDATKTAVVVQSVEPFNPTPEEVEKAREEVRAMATRAAPSALRVSIDAARLPATVIDELKTLFSSFPGESEVVLEVQTSSGPRRLRLGADYKVAATAALRAELDHVLGEALLPAA